MSTHTSNNKITTTKIQSMKGKGSIVSLTAYTKPMAQMMDQFVDLIIVGDSTGMVAYGFDSTLPVTLDMMIAHGAAVVRGAERACVVIDMPFATYQESKEIAYRNASKVLIETGAQAIKIEGGLEMVETVQFLVKRGIPVMPHIGLRPQHANTLGGFKAQGRDDAAANLLVQEAKEFENAGAFSLLVEGVFENAAKRVTNAIKIPTIGIGASPECDGQVLVTEDILGLFSDYTPKFAKKYIDLSTTIKGVFAEYEREVRGGDFPTAEHCFGVKVEHNK
ncbi:3-methyl-2-oxobutanoate hydroxymethyltransferase 2-Ketopantoate hydroxymethyltransferase 2 [Moritella viscosa]|uniref:3-methyl-2-oxobutanoate hydroxymethyltransferase n=1 Tax=Moritella viscosa TaxID=80854 RepID=UPI000913DAEC|nr:3-methyl-2-oxobutanoate hydroxymethyltransferase [Moritella viscosa]SGY89353.1 3-methyl-2-oxobutanoate hydroxymethyltransferase 2-Ketopantoate hydroxymethyltransferase 2 [Moritella viscosa]